MSDDTPADAQGSAPEGPSESASEVPPEGASAGEQEALSESPGEAVPQSPPGDTSGGARAGSPAAVPRRQRPGRRRRRRLVVTAVVVVVLVWLGVCALFVFQARRDAQAGLDRLQSVQADLTAADMIRGQGLPELRDAQHRFERASTRAHSVLLWPLRFVPVVGRQVRSVEALSGSAARVVRVGADAMDTSSRTLRSQPGPGPGRVALVEKLGSIAGSARARLVKVDLGPGDALIGPLRRARTRFADQLGKIQTALSDARDASTGIAALLQGPSRYLVVAANNAEMRAGSGMFLSVGVLDLADGSFHVPAMQSTYDAMLPPGAVEPTGDVAARWGWTHPTQDWRFLAMWPRFDATGPLVAKMWQSRTGQSVQGVIVLDPVALSALLRATGPVVVDGTTITADNVVHEVLLQQYVDLGGTSVADVSQLDQIARREKLGEIARAVVSRFDTVGWDASTLVDQLRSAAGGRHVLAWSSQPDEQRAWDALGVSGRLTSGSVLASVLNVAGNKLDQFLAVDARVTHVSTASGTRVTIAFTLRNQSPDGLPVYVQGPFPNTGLSAGEYLGYLSVDVPGASKSVAATGGGPLVTQGADGVSQVLATQVRLARGQSSTVTVSFTLPSSMHSLRVEPSARVPAIQWSDGASTFPDSQARTVAW